jgi:hypothetical protein
VFNRRKRQGKEIFVRHIERSLIWVEVFIVGVCQEINELLILQKLSVAHASCKSSSFFDEFEKDFLPVEVLLF